MPRKIWIAVIALLLAAVAIPSALFATQSQTGTEARINAYKHEDGRIEFGLQLREGDSWGERILPRGRTLRPNAAVGRWLSSTPVTLHMPFTPVRSPDALLLHNQDVGFCSGWGCAEGPETHITVSGRATSRNEVSLERSEMVIACLEPYEGHLPGGGWVRPEAHFSGYFTFNRLGEGDHRLHRSFWSTEPPPLAVLAREYSWRWDDQTQTNVRDEVEREDRFDINDDEGFFYGGSFSYRWLVQLRGYTDIWVQFWTEEYGTVQVHFYIDGLFGTPVQPNIDHCGDY